MAGIKHFLNSVNKLLQWKCRFSDDVFCDCVEFFRMAEVDSRSEST
jgi:hypothetical protein